MFTLQSYLSAHGAVRTGEMPAAISRWSALYKNSGTMSLASAIASETARLVTLDMKSEVSGSARADLIAKPYGEVLSDMRRICELACAHGGIVLKPYVSRGKIAVSYVRAENYVPYAFDESGKVCGAVFLDRAYEGKKVYTRLERHSLKNELYTIENSVFVSFGGSDLGKPVPLSAVDKWRGISKKVTITGVEKPLFAYFKMPMANCIEPGSPLGVSVYARAESLIADAQKQYDRLIWEFESGERAIYVDETAVKKTRDKVQLPEKRLYRMINSSDDLFEDWTPEFRDGAILNGLNELLRRLEFSCGLAYGTLSDIDGIDRTAEEFRASRQRSYAQVLDIQTSLSGALRELVAAMDALADLYELSPRGDVNVSFEFDDSIAADRQVEFDEKMRLLDKGIIAPWEMRAWYFGESTDTAKQRVSDVYSCA